jgi:hypothetical protein
MSVPGAAQLREYLRLHPIPGLAEPLQVEPGSSGPDEQHFLISSGAPGGARAVFTRYAPAAAERARREAAGLRLAGQVALAPALLLFDAAGGGLGGPVVVFTDPAGLPLGGRPLADAETQGWLFLLLTLHHLAPDGVSGPSTLSPDIATWWKRMQPAWQACKSAYGSRQTRGLLDALNKLQAVAGARVEARQAIWRGVTQRPCHGNAVPSHVLSDNGRLTLVEWGDFGLGDPAMEVGRAAVLARLAGELSGDQYTQFVGGYLRGANDFGDATLSDRLVVFTSVLPLGYAFTLLQLLSRGPMAPAERASTIAQVERALSWTADALGVKVGELQGLLAPVAAGR